MSKKDFRNMQQTQFDPGQVLKGSFSEQSSALRTVPVNGIIKDTYTNIVQTLDALGRPTRVEYYQANSSTIDTINFTADVGGNSAGDYYSFTNPVDKKVYVLYQVVSGVGAAPGVGDVELPVTYDDDDSASLVMLSNLATLKLIDDIKIIAKSVLNSSITIEYLQFGEAAVIDLNNSSFFATRLKEGESTLVGEVDLSYDQYGEVIYNGNVLKGLTYNLYTGSFDVNGSSSKDRADSLIYLPDSSNSAILYVGTAQYGTETTEAKWKIQRIDTTTGVVITNASTNFDQVWDNREALVYV